MQFGRDGEKEGGGGRGRGGGGRLRGLRFLPPLLLAALPLLAHRSWGKRRVGAYGLQARRGGVWTQSQSTHFICLLRTAPKSTPKVNDMWYLGTLSSSPLFFSAVQSACAMCRDEGRSHTETDADAVEGIRCPRCTAGKESRVYAVHLFGVTLVHLGHAVWCYSRTTVP